MSECNLSSIRTEGGTLWQINFFYYWVASDLLHGSFIGGFIVSWWPAPLLEIATDASFHIHLHNISHVDCDSFRLLFLLIWYLLWNYIIVANRITIEGQNCWLILASGAASKIILSQFMPNNYYSFVNELKIPLKKGCLLISSVPFVPSLSSGFNTNIFLMRSLAGSDIAFPKNHEML